jgi:hypothetical protein
MRTRAIAVMFLFLAVLLALYSKSRVAVSACRQDFSVDYRLNVASLPPDLMRIFAGEFRGLWADYLLLEIGSLTGGKRELRQEEWEQIALAFAQALELDPYFEQTYIYVQGNLPWDGEMPEKTIELLNVSKTHRTWDWRPGYYMAFDYYYFLKDYSGASELFLDAARIKGAPLLLAVLGARFALRGGRTEAAIILLQSMLDDPELGEADKKQVLDRITASKGVLLLEKAIEKYKNRYDAYPPSLETLIEKGIVEQLPENPYADTYFYAEKDGQVFFDELR